MQFMLMCCSENAHWRAIPETERDEIMREYGEWVDAHIASGHYLGGGKLDESETASTVRNKDGKAGITDGPFAETREQIGGYHVIECRDREEALAIAQTIPTLKAGSVIEVRPLLYQTTQTAE